MYAKLKNLSRPEFLRAVIFWALRKMTGVQIHDVFAKSLGHDTRDNQESIGRVLPLFKFYRSQSLLDPIVEDQLNEHSGASCRELIAQGCHVYYALDGSKVAVQLNILYGKTTVDSPIDLLFSLAPGVAFLNYLYTRPECRGLGLANHLMAFACSEERQMGIHKCLAHVRSTNHASQRAFNKAGWKRRGRIVTTRGGNLLGTQGCASLGLNIRKPLSS
ncbi:hypothetical protein CWI75_14915 [Kineobactrum sediminis]|uniref:N-acetyltransferase domain-containing protein n=1 Tax=Kineobactrum sediminis TaxID=1905677 RepID=A0A2N5XZF7_9GAMM|nr:GNAT family N-acetyltransferase [Kineobactrum sediminis]PLW81525.1 hypothetical protein CWI75_14915 [Kineobactrum sediminis]